MKNDILVMKVKMKQQLEFWIKEEEEFQINAVIILQPIRDIKHINEFFDLQVTICLATLLDCFFHDEIVNCEWITIMHLYWLF